MNSHEILMNLAELAEYIRWCERNSAEDSDTKKKCGAWLNTVNEVRVRILAKMESEEDAGY